MSWRPTGVGRPPAPLASGSLIVGEQPLALSYACIAYSRRGRTPSPYLPADLGFCGSFLVISLL
jgi:hypothetical protein